MFSLESGLTRVVRFSVLFQLSRSLLPGVWVPLATKLLVWIEIKC